MNTKYIIEYHREAVVRYVSHLDFVRVMNRVIRRAELPMAYSEGFNPHPLMGFALPLSTGVTSSCEKMELTLKEEMPANEFLKKLQDNMPQGFTVASVTQVPPNTKSPIKGITRAVYRVAGVQEVEANALADFMSKTEILVDKRTKSGIKNTDIRQDIFSLTQENGELVMELSAGNERNLKPETVLLAMELYITGFSSAYDSIHRQSMM